jgi:cytochrome c2/glucose/arabinose dehydrogenase
MFALTLALWCAIAYVSAAETADDDDDTPPELPAGLSAEITANDRTITRIDPELRFDWTEGPVDPRLPSGDFMARWTGKLSVIAPGVHRFHIYASGGIVRVSLGGQRLVEESVDEPRWLDSEPVELEYGHHAIAVEFSRESNAAQLGLYWSGPRFRLEPVPQRALLHEPHGENELAFEQGRQLVHGLRCAACHEIPAAEPAPSAPSLAKLDGNIARAWLMNWIGGATTDASKNSASAPKATSATREGSESDHHPAPAIDDVKFRMPGLGLNREDARHIVAYLLDETGEIAPPRKHQSAAIAPADAAAGETLFNSLGCLACHALRGLGSTRLSGGGELTNIADKRPADFFARWLADPASTNPTHRMPVFPLSTDERQHLAAFLAGQHAATTVDVASAEPRDDGGDQNRGRALVAAHHCGSCHELPARGDQPAPKPAAISKRKIVADSDWEKSCLGEPDPALARPGYRLRSEQRAAVVAFLREIARAPAVAPNSMVAIDGARVLQDRNCLGCHSRGLAPGIAAITPAVAAAHRELGAALATLTPPALTDVGDKLERPALLEAMTVAGDPRRPWLKIRMPRFRFAPGEAEALADWLIRADRLPLRPAPESDAIADAQLAKAGGRLVTAQGFGCASCHQIGKSIPKQDNLAARGTDLSLLGKRIRREWFDRWVRNPARIVPRMEMPAIEIPAGGVLNERLDDQLTAVWHVLNQPGFTPAAATAVRVVHTRNMPDDPEPAAILTDVLRVEKRAYVRPFVIGLANRHTVLFDPEQNRLAGWWIGDAARERTEGKRWFWEPGGTHLLAPRRQGSSELLIKRDGQTVAPLAAPQFVALVDSWQHVERGVSLDYRLTFPAVSDAAPLVVHVSQRVTTIATRDDSEHGGFERRLEIRGVPAGTEIVWRPLDEGTTGALTGQDYVATGGPAGDLYLRIRKPDQAAISDVSGPTVTATSAGPEVPVVFTVEYRSQLAADCVPTIPTAPQSRPAATLHGVPGFDAVRLPLPSTEMPTGFAWRPDGTLLFTSLKGGAWLAPDTDGDGLADTLRPLADELAAPYGLYARSDGTIDVSNKNGLLRLSDFDDSGRARRTDVVADGWGHTADYHDWAIGPEPDGSSGYYLALPCRQDERSDAAARWRGWAVHLVPRTATSDNPRPYELVPFCSGLRFPMGLARNTDGALFATDNQGHYNPYNELNHLTAGAHYGFMNKSEAKQGTPPPRRDAAIEIPHPWTRSVNGICFLNTPEGVRAKTGHDAFGPWEGHLVGCEYDTRRLIRMSLENVGDEYQGAAYPLSTEPAEGEETFEGPIACQVAPDGSLYIGNLRDSGWGAGQNTGSIVRLRPRGPLPPGIAEVRAASHGFAIYFTQEIDATAAANAANYVVESFRRIPTSDYGGPDVDRRTETVRSIEVADDRRSVRLALDSLRPGFVYEFHLRRLSAPGRLFFPSEAYYTLRVAPTEH